MADDVLINKASIIERCLKRIQEEYSGDPKNLREDFTRQDAIILNLERCCEGAIDIAMRLVRKLQLGVPQESREAFDMLAEAGLISPELSTRMKMMVGFRNVAVHDYQKLNLDIVQSVLETRLDDFRQFVAIALDQARR